MAGSRPTKARATRWILLLSLCCLTTGFGHHAFAATDLIKYNSPLPAKDAVFITLNTPPGELATGEPYLVTAPTGKTYSGELREVDDHLRVIPFAEGEGALEIRHEPEGQASLTLFINQSCLQYGASIDEGGVGILEQEISSVFCTDLAAINFSDLPYAEQQPLVFNYTGETDVRELESRPGSPYTILLDFWGGTVRNTHWNARYHWWFPIQYSAYDYADGDASSLTSTEEYYIQQAWQKTSEDYAPFVVNVTTDVSVFNATPPSRRARNIITSKPWWYADSSRGVGHVNGWGSDYTNISWTWFDDPNQITPAVLQQFLGTIVSHEVGHTLGLSHHGNTSQAEPEYHEGNGVWGPIMGAPVGASYTHWSRGDYPGATRPGQNDVAIINNILPFRPDDVASSAATAQSLSSSPFTYTREITPEGIRPDTDYYTFNVADPSSLFLHVRPATNAAGYDDVSNLAMSGELGLQNSFYFTRFNASDNNPLRPATNEWIIEDLVLQPGNYTFYIRHDSPDTNFGTGFSNYGNGGKYEIDLRLTAIDPPSITSPLTGTLLNDNRVEVTWDANGTPVENWRVMAGTTPGGSEWYDSGPIQAFLDRKMALNLPIDGQSVYLTLGYLPQGGNASSWVFLHSDVIGASLRLPEITRPASGSALDNDTVTFAWQANDFRNIRYHFLLGSSAGASDLFSSITSNTSRAIDLSGAEPGQSVYATLKYQHNTQGIGWHEVSALYRANRGPVLVAPDRSGAGSNPTYAWTHQEDVQRYQIEIRHLDPAYSTLRKRYSPSAARCDVLGDHCAVQIKNFPIKDVIEIRVRARRVGLGWGDWSFPTTYAP